MEESRRKVNALIELENDVQAQWKEEKIFEEDAGEAGRETYVATFPYPYVNGRFHLGHAFTVSKAEFAVSYQRLRGKHCLFPFGMHCTGMPIVAAAQRIERELEKFGFPPKFPVEDQFVGYDFMRDEKWQKVLEAFKVERVKANAKKKGGGKKKGGKKDEVDEGKLLTLAKRKYFHENVNSELPVEEQTETAEEAEKRRLAELAKKAEQAADLTKSFHSKKTKAAQKGGSMRQWYIMKQLDIPDDEIPKFSDPGYWLQFFPPLYRDDLSHFGLKIDWRRSFITTDANPYYDSFVRWQFNTLNAQGRLRFAKRYSIYSPKDGQPCMDHDRSSGEGVLPKEYTLIKMKVNADDLKERFPGLVGKNVFLAPATLRPETMYGQTNCWVSPDIDYGAFEISDDDVLIITERAATNLAFQGHSKTPGEVSCIQRMTGRELLGLRVEAPLALQYPEVYVLPMSTVKDTMGTGVVTSVPSDSPDDYVSLIDLRKSPEWMERCGVKPEWVEPFDPVPIIRVPAIGKNNEPSDQSAVLLCTEMKINGPKQRELLDEAKKEAYVKGFHDGVMIVGKYADTPVSEAKPKVRDDLMEMGYALKYSEPDGTVVSRTGDTCIVALTDQWYIHYGKDDWKELATKALGQLNTYSDTTRERFHATLNWLEEWACSRTFGLGTYLPWDNKYLIDSLSDSTIYMAYYTIAHILQRGELDPRKLTPEALKANPIQPEQMTYEVWEYIFRGGDMPETTIDKAVLETMRSEFLYWYPVSLRVSGNDLINNHLTFFLFNHVAMFPEEHWPKAVRTNGFLLLDGEKMSKSTGNFMTLAGALNKFGVDATRYALAGAGDSVDDSNFTEENANVAIMKLFTQLEWVKEVLSTKESMRSGEHNFSDRWFVNEIAALVREAEAAFENMQYQAALHAAFILMQGARDRYLTMVGSAPHGDVLMQFITKQVLVLSPICPHWCDHVWRKVLGNEKSVLHAAWPEVAEVDEMLRRQGAYLEKRKHEIAKQLAYFEKKVLKAPAASGIVYIASCYPPDQAKALEVLGNLFKQSGEFPSPKEVSAAFAPLFDKKKVKVLMKFVMATKEYYQLVGESAFDLTAPIDEAAVLRENMQYIMQATHMPFEPVVVVCGEDGNPPEGVPEKRKDKNVTMPMRPSYFFEKEG